MPLDDAVGPRGRQGGFHRRTILLKSAREGDHRASPLGWAAVSQASRAAGRRAERQEQDPDLGRHFEMAVALQQGTSSGRNGTSRLLQISLAAVQAIRSASRTAAP